MGNIAATIQAPNLTVTSGGQIVNVGNVVGQSVSLTGTSLVNGITTANTYTPQVGNDRPLDTAQRAALTTLAGLVGALGADMAGADANAGAFWAQNEATNNAENHQGGTGLGSKVLGAFASLLNARSDLRDYLARQFLLAQRQQSGEKPPADANPLAQENDRTPPTGGSVVGAPPVMACAPNGTCTITPPIMAGGGTSVPGNWTLSAGNGGDETTGVRGVPESGKGGASNGTSGTTSGDMGGAGGTWGREPTERGVYIERQLSKTEYSESGGWFHVGETNNGYFPLVDFQNGSTLVSLKSVDTRGSGWLNRMQEVIDSLGSSGATVNNIPANMVLDLRVQPGDASAAQSLVAYGQSRGVAVIIKVFQ